MKNARPKRVALLAALFAVICAGHAAAQTPPASRASDPLLFVQAATACVHRAGDVPDEWRRTLQRAQLWSLYYGYSLAQTYSRTSDTPPANCAANMGRLQTALTSAESTFMAGWRGVELNARTIQNGRALLTLTPDYAYGWCDALIAAAAPVVRYDPALLSIDRATPEGEAQISAMLREFSSLAVFYDQRSFEAEPADEAGRQTARAAYERAKSDFDSYRLSVTQLGDVVRWFVNTANGRDTPFPSREAQRRFLTTELAACRAARNLDF